MGLKMMDLTAYNNDVGVGLCVCGGFFFLGGEGAGTLILVVGNAEYPRNSTVTACIVGETMPFCWSYNKKKPETMLARLSVTSSMCFLS